jgi:hypothetical protein
MKERKERGEIMKGRERNKEASGKREKKDTVYLLGIMLKYSDSST